MMGSYGRYDDRYGDRGGRSGGYGGSSGGFGGGGFGGGRGGGRGNDLGADLHTIRWDLSTLPRFEKNFYREAESVRSRPDHEVY
jgi:ATP-dependent RNA helicase DDX5/DBP2